MALNRKWMAGLSFTSLVKWTDLWSSETRSITLVVWFFSHVLQANLDWDLWHVVMVGIGVLCGTWFAIRDGNK